jgi:NAD(P)-dependent dehydrogenase (short-subunit alcohol dehydrogenase family)
VSYRGKHVVVTGAASGMGRATAELLVADGAIVEAIDINHVPIDGATPHQVDMRRPPEIDAVARRITAPVDALFNCAGLPQTFPATDILEVAFFGLRQLTELLVSKMSAGSSIVSVASIGGLGWPPNLDRLLAFLALPNDDVAREWCQAESDLLAEPYRLAKQAVIVYSMLRGSELIERGIRMNCTSPGDTNTGMTPAFREFYGDDVIDSMPNPIGRAASAEEQARVLLFLNSPDASYVAATNLIVDGGANGGIVTRRLRAAALPKAVR